jgi:hypothetical protein
MADYLELIERDRLRLLKQMEREQRGAIAPPKPKGPARHPRTGRFLAHDCEKDCQLYCAGLCGRAMS